MTLKCCNLAYNITREEHGEATSKHQLKQMLEGSP